VEFGAARMAVIDREVVWNLLVNRLPQLALALRG
jgi:hypothetical protein